ncbi:MAG: beta-lactamase family protein [Clostridiaceae bacterium]|jgi:CubicO group peptidase (beta-lactamase class C family)|nr:beta-lactamase family protein [Clostridiaceae bacterium]
MIEDIRLPRASTPEEVGVSSADVLSFLSEVEEKGLELHGFMVIRNGVVAVECFRAPFQGRYNHQMWSVSKSFTATAVGLAIGEDLLTLDTAVAQIFPEYKPKKNDKNWRNLTIRHLVTMTSGKSPKYLSPKGDKADWIKTYIAAPWYNEPGREFRYINENFYMLSAIIRRITGVTLSEYLTPRLYAPLGIERAEWETDNKKNEAGGWGFSAKTEDLAKLILCYQQGGVFNGKRILDEAWTREASKKQTDCVGLHSATNHGYGYGFWMNPFENSYRANGMFSQFGIDFTEQKGIFVCNAAVIDEESLHDLVFKYFPKAFKKDGEQAISNENALENATASENGVAGAISNETNLNGAPASENDYARELRERIAASMVEPPPLVSARSEFEKSLNGKIIKFKSNLLLNRVGFPVGALPIIVAAKSAEKQRQINRVRFDFEDASARFSWTEGKQKNSVSVGLDGNLRQSEMTLGGITYSVLGSAVWLDEKSLQVSLRAVETIAKRVFTFRFSGGGKVLMIPDSTPAIEGILNFLTEGAVFLFKFKPLLKLIRFVISLLPKRIEPAYKGRITVLRVPSGTKVR